LLKIHVPRLSYLPTLLPRLHDFFSPFLIHASEGSHTGWLSFEGVPLKWHYPVGLLYDLFSGAEFHGGGRTAGVDKGKRKGGDEEEQRRSGDDVEEESGVLPWKLVLHFTEWPEEHLLGLDEGGKYFHDNFVNAVKEADVIRNGTGNIILQLSEADSRSLWASVQYRE
jgi:autophagy-related protein 5